MEFRGVPLTSSDRTCLAIMMAPAQTKGWRGDSRKALQGFAEMIRLFRPGASTPVHVIARIDEATVVLMTGDAESVVGQFPTLMDALCAVSKLIGEHARRLSE